MRNVVTDAYVNNATVTGILYKLPAINPDVAAAVDEGFGDVGIPCEGHEKVIGDTIRLERMINYRGAYVLQTGTTADVLSITATYVAETFTGEELIYEAIVGTVGSPIAFSYEATSNGNYVGKIANTEKLILGEDYVLCIKEISGAEQVLAKVIQVAGFHGL